MIAEPVMIGATPGALLPAPITALAFPVCMFAGEAQQRWGAGGWRFSPSLVGEVLVPGDSW